MYCSDELQYTLQWYTAMNTALSTAVNTAVYNAAEYCSCSLQWCIAVNVEKVVCPCLLHSVVCDDLCNSSPILLWHVMYKRLHCISTQWGVLSCSAVQCTVQRTAVKNSVLHCRSDQCSAVQWSVLERKIRKMMTGNRKEEDSSSTLHCTGLHCTALDYTALQYTALFCTEPHCTALNCTALLLTAFNCLALHCTALHYLGLHCTVLHCTVLHYTALHWNIVSVYTIIQCT